MDQLQDYLVRVLGTAHFRDWVWISAGVVALALLYRPTFRAHLETGSRPGLAALAGLALLFAMLSRRAMPTGDEPHYLIMTQSLLADGDFDLRNNYENRDYQAYHPAIIPDPHVIVRGEAWYPVHAIGLPVLAAPAYAAGGRMGVVGLLTVCTVAGLGLLWSLLQLAGFGARVAGWATAAAGLTLPVTAMAGQVFPEVPAFLLVVVALRALIPPEPSRRDRVGLLLSVGILPWLHPKYALLSAALLVALALVSRGRAGAIRILEAAGVLIASVAGHAVLSYAWYGAALPGASVLVTRGPTPMDWLPAIIGHFFVTPWVGLTGVLFDQHSGLFLASPVYLLAIPGLVLLWRRARTAALVCILIFLGVYLLAGSYGVWYGGYSSPARLLMPTVPVLALAVAAMLDAAGPGRRWLFVILAVPSLAHAYLVAALPSFTRYGDPLNHHNFFIGRIERLFGLDLTPLFPSFRNPEPTTWLTTAAYLLIIVALSVTLVRRSVPRAAA